MIDDSFCIPMGEDTTDFSKISPSEIADFILEQDKIPIICALSLYTNVIERIGNFVLVPNSFKIRTAAWFDTITGHCIVGCRGTTVGGKKSNEDLLDDSTIAGFTRGSYCDLSLVFEIEKIIEPLLNQITFIIFAGHSLGGTAAFCLCQKYDNARAICFNPGATPLNPILSSLKPEAINCYHIVGDLISSHMGPKAANIVRINKSTLNQFGKLWPHESSRILKRDGGWKIVDANFEQNLYLQWGKNYNLIWKYAKTFFSYLKNRDVVKHEPIPGSNLKRPIIKSKKPSLFGFFKYLSI